MVIGFIIFCIIICLIVSAVTRKDASKSGGTNINSVPKKTAISIVGGINHFSAENFGQKKLKFWLQKALIYTPYHGIICP